MTGKYTQTIGLFYFIPQSLVEKRQFDGKKQEIVSLEQQLKRVNSSSAKQQKEIQGAFDSVTQYRRQVCRGDMQKGTN